MAIGMERIAQQEKNQQHLVADYLWETETEKSGVNWEVGKTMLL